MRHEVKNNFPNPSLRVITPLSESIIDEVNKTDQLDTDFFCVKPANKWMEDAMHRPIPKQLFKELWFSGELCILFADSNVGKSILAVQIGNDLAKDEQVIYFDFELSDKQFELRYSSNFQNHFLFPDNFLRAEINPDCDFTGFECFEDFLISSLEKVIIKTGIKILIIDNITYLKNETDKAKNALPLMKQLKALKQKYDLSILVLAHTPKRDLSKPITQNDLQGSKAIMNFCDSAFAIGSSQVDKNIRYLKQIKERNTPKIYDSENVIVYQITKPDNFLFMEFIRYGYEREHLKQVSGKDRDNLIQESKELYSKGMSIREISKQLSLSTGAVHKYIHITDEHTNK